jgi:hypothetical protein
MKLRAFALTLGAALLLSVSAYADTFTAPTGPLGPSSVFTIGTSSVTVYAFTAPSTAGVLYSKNSGANETGLGLMSGGSDHEISGTAFLTIDIQNILNLGATSLAISMQSVQHPDEFDIWGSNTLGTPGTLLFGPDGMNATVDVPGFSSFRYISVSAPKGDVLLHDLEFTASTPEPSSIALLFLGLLCLAGIVKYNKSAVLSAN